MHTRLFVVALVALVVCVYGRAAADDADLWETRRSAFELHVGAGTPIGYLGLMYDHALSRRVSVSGGLGTGSGREESGSLQLAGGVRFRFVQHSDNALYIGMDYSTGGWREFDLSLAGLLPSHSSVRIKRVIYSTRVHWLNATGGYEYRNTAGYAFRAYAGFATMLNPGSRECVEEVSNGPCGLGENDYGDPTILILGISFGFTI